MPSSHAARRPGYVILRIPRQAGGLDLIRPAQRGYKLYQGQAVSRVFDDFVYKDFAHSARNVFANSYVGYTISRVRPKGTNMHVYMHI